jgi:hypothetical protein
MNEPEINQDSEQTLEESVQGEGPVIRDDDPISSVEEPTDTVTKKVIKKVKKQRTEKQIAATSAMREKLLKIRAIKKDEKDEAKKQSQLEKLNIKADAKKKKEKEKIISLVPEIINDNKGMSRADVKQLIKEEKESRKIAKLEAKNKKTEDIRKAKELLGIVDEPVVVKQKVVEKPKVERVPLNIK